MRTSIALAALSAALALAPSAAFALTQTEGYGPDGQPRKYEARKNGLPCHDFRGCEDSRRVMWCTDAELTQFPDLHTTTPDRHAQAPGYFGGLYPGAINIKAIMQRVVSANSSVPTCKEAVVVTDEFETPEQVAAARNDILAKHPGAKMVMWYWAQNQGGIWNCPFKGTYPTEIYYGGSVANTPIPPTTPDTPDPKTYNPKSTSTDPNFGGVPGGNMHDGVAAGSAGNGTKGMAQASAQSVCNRGGRPREAVERCLKLLK